MQASLDIPVIAVARSGREWCVGQASDIDSAERLAIRLQAMYDAQGRGVRCYIDCSQSAADWKAQSA